MAAPKWLQKLEPQNPPRNLRCLGLGTRIQKRLLDVIVAVGLVILTSPLMLLVAILVRLTSRGPFLFSQERVGLNLRRDGSDRRRQNNGDSIGMPDRRQVHDRRLQRAYGRPFRLYKFRTMRVDAEENGAQLASQGDPRITTLGRFLRKTRIDELPQLWNVLTGEMSMVGPRPERNVFVRELTEHIPDYLTRLGLKPGLTGVAQICNGYDNTIEGFRRKVGYDIMYIQNCCLNNDIRILLRTIPVVLTGHGAL